MADRHPEAMYDSLARFQWWRRQWARPLTGEDLEMRKRLDPPNGDGPANSGAGLDLWLMQRVVSRSRGRLLDLGCGFGASMLRWLRTGNNTEQALGITPSAYQIKRGRQVAMAQGVADSCTFLRQPLELSLPGSFDVVLAIESLGHTRDLARVLRNVRESMHEGGTLVWVEDLLLRPSASDSGVLALSDAWSSPPLRSVDEVRSLLQVSGFRVLEEIDLTPQVPHRDRVAVERSLRLVRRLQMLMPIPFARRVSQAFTGGFLLEDLYVRGLACYRVVMAEPAQVSN